MVLCLGQGLHALHHLAVRLRIAELEGQLFKLFLDGIQPEETSQRGKDLRIGH